MGVAFRKCLFHMQIFCDLLLHCDMPSKKIQKCNTLVFMTSFCKADSFDDLRSMQINEINGKLKWEMLKVIKNDPLVGVLSVAILIAKKQTGCHVVIGCEIHMQCQESVKNLKWLEHDRFQ